MLLLDQDPEKMAPLKYGDLIARWKSEISEKVQDRFSVTPRWFAPVGTGDYMGPGEANDWFVEE